MSGVVLVTGAGGFIGRAVVRRLETAGHRVRRTSRRAAGHGDVVRVEIGPGTDWRAALDGAMAVVHLAGVVHRRGAGEREHERVDVLGTRRLAEQAAAAGVRRFVYSSSLAVYGVLAADRPIDERTPVAPCTPYGRAKCGAEQALLAIAGSMEPVVLRPPMVHGLGAPANLGALAAAVRRGLPLPLAGTDNRRSLLGRQNLADFVELALRHPAAAGETFVLADARPVSTEELVRLIAEGLGRRPRLFRAPRPLLAALRASARGRTLYEKLFGSLEVDASHARRTLDWRPALSIEEGLRAVGREETPWAST